MPEDVKKQDNSFEKKDRADRIAFFRTPLYPHRWLAPTVSALLYLACAFYVGLNPQKTIDGKVQHDLWSLVFIVSWAAGPPLAFLLEYVWVGSKDDNDLPSIESFKYSQELASKVWAVAVAILVFLYAGKIPGGA